MRIYPTRINEFDIILKDFPEKIKKDIIKSQDCKKLNGLSCSPYCSASFTFTMDGEEYKKCRNMAFFLDLNDNNRDYIMKLIENEMA